MLIRADARQIPLRDGCVQCVVTSPPYWGLRDYGAPGQMGLERTPEEYLAGMVEVFREVRRVLREDGTVWINIGDSYSGSSMSGGVGKGTIHGSQQGARKNQDLRFSGKRDDGLKPKDLCGIPWRVAFALQADGWYLRSDIIWHKPNPMPESVTDRPTKAHEYLFLLSKSARYFYDAEAIKEPSVRPGEFPGGNYAGRDIPDGLVNRGWLNKTGVPVSRNRRSVWTVATESFSGAHFATFPRKLIEPCILAGSRPGDLVFDPFVGSGTTVMVARGLGRRGVGTDITYQALSTERIHGPLFAGTVNA